MIGNVFTYLHQNASLLSSIFIQSFLGAIKKRLDRQSSFALNADRKAIINY